MRRQTIHLLYQLNFKFQFSSSLRMRLYTLFCSQMNIPTRYHIKHIPDPFTPELSFNYPKMTGGQKTTQTVSNQYRVGLVVSQHGNPENGEELCFININENKH